MAGAPSKYKPEYCEIALELIGRQGRSIIQLARHLEVNRDSIYEWASVHPEFSDILTRAKDWSEAYWEDRFVEFMTDRNVNAPLVKLYFANRFKWSDANAKTDDNETPPPIEVTIERKDARKPEQPAG